MQEVKVKISEKEKQYSIFIGNGLLDNLTRIIEENCAAKRFLVVTNIKVYKLYAKSLKNLKNVYFLVLKDGECYKNFDSYKKILDRALELKLDRKSAIIALGGGVIGDLAGFAASTYLRGIDFIQIPTTLLAQVDSSVGGKVGINHKKGKNLIGAFYQPKLVITDVLVLKTLDAKQLKTGLAEVLKYAFIEKACSQTGDSGLFQFLKDNKSQIFAKNPEVLSELIKKCCELKAYVVTQDEKEQGLRVILNFGHTFAHAIEKVTNYKKFTHGEAVALGMKMAFKLSLLKKLIDENTYNEANLLIDEYEICPKLTINSDKLIKAMQHDKKVENGKTRFVLATDRAYVAVFDDIETELIQKALKI